MTKLLISSKIIQNTIILIIVFELLSFIAFLQPLFMTPFFILIAIVFFCACLKDLSFGLYAVMGELMIGSKGYQFFLNVFGFDLSIRLAFFLILFFVFVLRWPQWIPSRKQFVNVQMSLLIVGIFIVWGILRGIFLHIPLDVFFDANGYLYFGLLPVFLAVLKDWNRIEALLSVMVGALLASILKISFVVYLFSHGFHDAIFKVYRWIRVTGVGEITDMGFGLYRIFFQSQIFHLMAWCILLPYLFWAIKQGNKKQQKIILLLLSLMNFSLLVSMSRSFWLAAIISLAFFLVFECIILKTGRKMMQKGIWISSLSVILCFCYALVLLFFPIPPSQVSSKSISLLSSRTDLFAEEAAITSRWKLLPPMMEAISHQWILGAGFGKTITYETLDPRILEQTQGELYTTYAFEWGYLDIWLKMGIGGLIAFCLLLIWLIKALYARYQETQHYLYLGVISACIALFITHFFSPYLNHPLGISILLFIICLLYVDAKPFEFSGFKQ